MLLTKFYTMTIELNVLEVIDLRVILKIRLLHFQDTLEKTKNPKIVDSISAEIDKIENLLNKIK